MNGYPLCIRLFSMVDTTAGPGLCWPWMGVLSDTGYGLITVRGRVIRATHAMLELAGRPVPKGMNALHDCDNPICVNPVHLYAGTQLENMQSAQERGRLSMGEDRPMSKLTEESVRAMRLDRTTGMTLEELATKYQVGTSTAHRAVTRKTWSHVQ